MEANTMTKQKYSLITFSGTHGSGKSTASKSFVSYLKNKNINCYLIDKRPIGTDYMNKTLKVVQSESNYIKIEPKYISFAYALDYYGDFKLNIEPLLNDGHVIMDRFIFDIYASVRARFCNKHEDYKDSWELMTNLIKNNSLHFYLDISANEAYNRIIKRGNRHDFETIENSESELFYYKKISECSQVNFHTINAEESQHQVLQRIINVYESTIQ
jgi:thymidylate kinase